MGRADLTRKPNLVQSSFRGLYGRLGGAGGGVTEDRIPEGCFTTLTNLRPLGETLEALVTVAGNQVATDLGTLGTPPTRGVTYLLTPGTSTGFRVVVTNRRLVITPQQDYTPAGPPIVDTTVPPALPGSPVLVTVNAQPGASNSSNSGRTPSTPPVFTFVPPGSVTDFAADGVDYGSPSYAQDAAVLGGFARAVFDGSDTLMMRHPARAAIERYDALTLGCVVMITTTGTPQNILSMQSGVTPFTGWSLYVDSNRNLRFRLQQNATQYLEVSTLNTLQLTAGGYYQLYLVKTPGAPTVANLAIYAGTSGTPKGLTDTSGTAITGSVKSPGDLWLGSEARLAGSFLTGEIVWAHVNDRKITAAELSDVQGWWAAKLGI